MYFFKDLVPAAKAGRLAHLPVIEALLSAEDFSHLPPAGSAAALPLELAVLQYMLARFPVHPEEVDRMGSSLDKGIVRLDFCELSNPVPVIFLVPGDPVIAQVKQALAANLRSPRFRAAQAIQKWKSRPKAWARMRGETAMLAKFRDSLPYPTPEDFRKNRDEALVAQRKCSDQVNDHERAVRHRRGERLQKLRGMAGIEGSWLQLLEDLAAYLQPHLSELVGEPA